MTGPRLADGPAACAPRSGLGSVIAALIVLARILALHGTATAVDPPHVSLTLNQATYRPGDRLILSAFGQTGPGTFDLYFWIRTPDAIETYLGSDGAFHQGSRPVAAGITIPDFSVIMFDVVLPADLPQGSYEFHIAGTRPAPAGPVEASVSMLFSATPPPPNATPNLTPFQPAGWSDRIVVSTAPGTSTDSHEIGSADTLYVAWAVLNDGNVATAARVYTELYVDGTLRDSWLLDPPLNPHSAWSVQNYSIGTLNPGPHTIRIRTDARNAIAESNEGDNEYTRTITVSGGIDPPSPNALPNLTPFQPHNWSDKIVVSTAPGTNTDSRPLTTADTLYVDWAVLNESNVATAVRFSTELYVDGVRRETWSLDPPLPPHFFWFIQDYSIGTLSAGTHTIRIRADALDAIAERLEGDNEYTKTITVSVGVPAPKIVTVANAGGAGLTLRGGPNLGSVSVGALPEGTQMTVIGGPVQATGFTWWNLTGAPGTGWSAVGEWLAPLEPGPGSTVTVTYTGGTGLLLRDCASVSCAIITALVDGTPMTVLAGPVHANGYTWWNLQGTVAGVSRNGWSALGNWLVPNPR